MEAESFTRWLKRLRRETSDLKAIVLAIDSPGGGVAASQELYRSIRRARDEGIVVVASVGAMAASGAYYAAIASDQIVCQPGSMTGSIGVIAEFPEAGKLFETIGLKFQIIKSGEYKDSGNPSRRLTEKEKKHFQGLIDDVHGQFVDTVFEERKSALRAAYDKQNLKLTDKELREKLEEVTDGRLLTGQMALEIGLVDKIGDREDAIDLASKLAGIDGDAEVVTRRKKRHWTDQLAGAVATRVEKWIDFNVTGVSAPVQYRIN